MKTTVKNLSDTKVLLTINLDAEELGIAEQVAATKLAKDLDVPGFRKGKVPASVAIKNIDPVRLHEQAANDAMSKAVATAFIENNLQPLERPEVDIKKFVPGESLEFTAEAEILPKVSLGDYKKLKVKVEKTTVSDKDVNDIIERIRANLAERKEVEREVKDGDEVIIDFVGKKDGEAFKGGAAKDFSLAIGSKQFIPGFEEGIVGHKTGEEFDLKLKFPDDYHEASLKGKDVVFTVTLKAIKEITLPEVDDKFASKVGPFKSVADMKDDIKRELNTQKEREANEKLKDELITQLVAASKVPVPEVLLLDQSKSIEQDFINGLAYQGLTLDSYLESHNFKSKDEWEKSEVHDVAKKRVQAGLVLAELSKLEKIEVSASELESQVALYRQQYGNDPETAKRFDSPEVRQNIENRIATEKTAERLVELNTKK